MTATLHVLHLLGAALWLGGTFALVFTAVPVLRTLEGRDRARTLRELGERWRPIGWGSLAGLGITGLAWAGQIGAFTHERIHSTWGVLFLVKLVLVALLVVCAYLHDFIFGPRLARQIRAGERETYRPRLVWFGWLSFVLSFGIPAVGVVLQHL